MKKTPESQLKAGAKYDERMTRRFGLKLNYGTDAELIEMLEKQPSIQGYIKKLIREDVQRKKH